MILDFFNSFEQEFNITSTYGQGECHCEMNYDYFGSDLLSKFVHSQEDCCDYCYKNLKCTSFTYLPSSKACFIKSDNHPIRIMSPVI